MARQSVFKRSRQAVNKQKNRVILNYMRENWDVVINSSVSMIKTLGFHTRFRFAMDIMFGNRKRALRAIRDESPESGVMTTPPPGKQLVPGK